MYTSGTALNHNDLLDRMITWLVGTVGWTQLDYSGLPSPDPDTALRDCVLRAPGATSGDEFFLYIDTRNNPGAGAYGWAIRGAIGYDSLVVPGSQEGASPEVFLNLWENAIDYWFYGNGRHVKVVAKCNTSYVTMYAGLFLPFALPSEYPKPFLVAGNYGSLATIDVANSANRFIVDPGQNSMFYLNRDANAWNAVANHAASVNNVSFVELGHSFMWPHRGIRSTLSSETIANELSWNQNGLLQMRPLGNGEIPMFKAHILSYGDLKAVGSLDGVYSAPGFGKTSEQSIVFSPRQFRVFQNVFRTTGRDYMAIEEI